MNRTNLQKAINKCRTEGQKTVVSFCSHIPLEILEAAGLCYFRLPYIADVKDSASKLLPKNLCPIVKNCCNICEDAALSDVSLILAETSCDGKKKMYELLSQPERIYFYQIPQCVDREYVKPLIQSECRYLAEELKKRFDISLSPEQIRTAGKLLNTERKSILNLMEIQRQTPPAAWGTDIFRILEEHRMIPDTASRIKANYAARDRLLSQKTPIPESTARILITGCPLSAVYDKILQIIEENGGVVVCFETCEASKYALRHFDTENPDVFAALADCYQNTSCAVMSPNDQRFSSIRQLCLDYQVDGILDVTLQTCHSYTVERDKMSRFCRETLCIPYMAAETDDSDSDIGQLETRIAAFLEMIEPKYLILAFKTTEDAMHAERYLKDFFSIAVMPVPREISAGCGLAIRFLNPDEAAIRDFLEKSPLHCALYKMGTKKINGKHPIEKLN